MKKNIYKVFIFIFLSLIFILNIKIYTNAASITASQVKGTWDGEYDGDWVNASGKIIDVNRHVTLIIKSCDNKGYFKGGLYIAAIPGKDYQFTGSYNISGIVNLSTGAINIIPGSWIKTISNFNKSYFRGTFQISSKTLTGYRYVGQSNSNSTRYKFSVKKTSNATSVNKLYYVTLSATNVTLKEGNTTTLKYSVSPNTITPSSVKWTSSNSSIAKVSSTGKVTAIKAGTVKITCAASYNNSTVKADCTIVVTASQKYTITGTVNDSVSKKPVSGAVVDARSGKNNQTGTIIATTKTNNQGKYTLSLPKGDYTLSITKKDFKNYYVNVGLSSNKTVNTSIVSSSQKFKLSGTIRDAATGSAVKDANVQARSGKNNKTGTVVASTKTNNSGTYSLTLPKGDYTVEISKKNFVSYFTNVSLTANKTVSTPITQAISATKFRVVLSWGKNPYDVDLHATGPVSGSGRFHTYFGNMNYSVNGFLLSHLDVDDRSSYGPETLTLDLSKGKTGTYHFYVHDYTNRSKSSTNALAKSGARVDVYNGNKKLASYSVPNKYGTVWQVFDLVNGQVKSIQKMSYNNNLLTQ